MYLKGLVNKKFIKKYILVYRLKGEKILKLTINGKIYFIIIKLVYMYFSLIFKCQVVKTKTQSLTCNIFKNKKITINYIK